MKHPLLRILQKPFRARHAAAHARAKAALHRLKAWGLKDRDDIKAWMEIEADATTDLKPNTIRASVCKVIEALHLAENQMENFRALRSYWAQVHVTPTTLVIDGEVFRMVGMRRINDYERFLRIVDAVGRMRGGGPYYFDATTRKISTKLVAYWNGVNRPGRRK